MAEVNFSKTKRGLILRFLVDKPTGGISLQECGMLNERLSELLDKENMIEGSYVLEVSSPGVDRPLYSEKDFLRVWGRRVKIFFNEPVDKKLEIEGVVDEVKDAVVFLRQGGQIIKIPLDKIKKAKQVII
jgi:ribosome maturation factor RimP